MVMMLPLLGGDGDERANGVSEGKARWQGEMVLACEAELVIEFFSILQHVSSGLYREGKKVRLLYKRQLFVFVVLAQCDLVGSGEGLKAGRDR